MVSGLMEEPLDSFVPPSGLAGRLHASEGSTFHFATRLKLAQALTGEPAPPRADSGGNAFAGACAKNQKRATSFAIEPVCYLQDLFTAEASRRKGVGRALIEEVYRQAKLSGCGRVYWHTQETNRTARALYDKVAEHLGFIRYQKQF